MDRDYRDGSQSPVSAFYKGDSQGKKFSECAQQFDKTRAQQKEQNYRNGL